VYPASSSKPRRRRRSITPSPIMPRRSQDLGVVDRACLENEASDRVEGARLETRVYRARINRSFFREASQLD
jgi:hypothetical protein